MVTRALGAILKRHELRKNRLIQRRPARLVGRSICPLALLAAGRIGDAHRFPTRSDTGCFSTILHDIQSCGIIGFNRWR